MKKILFYFLTLLISSNAYAVEVSTIDELTSNIKNNNDITITKDLSVPNTYTRTLTYGDYSIDGQNNTIDGSKQNTQFIRIMSGTIDKITNTTFDGFKNQVIPDAEDGTILDPDDNMGAVITNNGTINQIDANFTNNTAYHGGAIFNGYDGDIASINGTFTNNKSETYSDKVYTEASGAAIHNQGHIGNITGTFENNTAQLAGTIWNYGTIDNITATFKNNHRSAVGGNNGTVNITNSSFLQNDTKGRTYYWTEEDGTEKSTNYGQSGAGVVWWGNQTFNIKNTTFNQNQADWKGGAIAGWNGGTLKLENSYLMNNQASEEGGAIYQTGPGTAEIINTSFTSNKARTGGAIYNTATYTITDSIFQNNQDTVSWSKGGGAIANGGTMNLHNSLISGNSSQSYGGGISNFGGTLTFNNNQIINNSANYYGGGIYTSAGKIVINNSTLKDNLSKHGGAGASLSGEIEINNSTIQDNQSRQNGGAFYVGQTSNNDTTTFGTLNINNSVIKNNASNNIGGAIFVENGTLNITNSLITQNESLFPQPQTTNTPLQKENQASNPSLSVIYTPEYFGAIHSLKDISLKANNGTTQIIDNNTKSNNIGIYMEGYNSNLNIETKNQGYVYVSDIISGENYNINIQGDITDYSTITKDNINTISHTDFTNQVLNLNNLNLNQGAVLRFSKDETLTTNHLTGNNGAILLEATMDNQTQTLTNGLITVNEDVKGTTNVILNFLKDDTTNAPLDVLSPFVTAPNDNKETSASFNVAAVIGSPYAWVSKYNAQKNETGSTWYLGLNKHSSNFNEKYEHIIYRPEIPTYIGFSRVAIEQTRSLKNSVKEGINTQNNTPCQNNYCRFASITPSPTAWIDISYEKTKITSPTDIESTLQGTTIGLDFYRDYHHKAGIFGSYTKGEYDFSGKGDYTALIGSKIDAKSTSGGFYYQYNKNNYSLLALIFAGSEDMDIKTDDALIDDSTKAAQFGISFELAKKYAISKHLDLEPSLGIYYSATKIDDFSDKLGKDVSFDTINYLETELALKLEYLCCRKGCANNWYIKPSIIKTYAHNASTHITGLKSIKSYEDELLGRIVVGTKFGITPNLSGFASGGYTFGSDYKSYDANAGLTYSF